MAPACIVNCWKLCHPTVSVHLTAQTKHFILQLSVESTYVIARCSSFKPPDSGMHCLINYKGRRITRDKSEKEDTVNNAIEAEGRKSHELAELMCVKLVPLSKRKIYLLRGNIRSLPVLPQIRSHRRHGWAAKSEFLKRKLQPHLAKAAWLIQRWEAFRYCKLQLRCEIEPSLTSRAEAGFELF